MSDMNLYFEKLLLDAFNKCNGMFVRDLAKSFQLPYPFTTENISGYINEFDLKDKSLLTVGSSGDQIINGSLFGCHNIACLDICTYAKFYIYLKISCLLELDKKQFYKFLCYIDFPKLFKYNSDVFDKAVFGKN